MLYTSLQNIAQSYMSCNKEGEILYIKKDGVFEKGKTKVYVFGPHGLRWDANCELRAESTQVIEFVVRSLCSVLCSLSVYPAHK